MPRSRAVRSRDDIVVLSDREVWVSALAMIQQHGPDAAIHARMHLDMFAAGDELDGQLAWLRIIEAIAWLQDDLPAKPAVVH